MHKGVIHTEVRFVTSEKSIFLIVVSGYILWHENSSPQACGQDKHSNCSNTMTVYSVDYPAAHLGLGCCLSFGFLFLLSRHGHTV